MFRYIDDQVCYTLNARPNDVLWTTEGDGCHSVVDLKRLLLGSWLVGQKQVSRQDNGQAGVLQKGLSTDADADQNSLERVLPSC